MVITKPEANVVYELDHNNNIYQVYPLPSTLYSIQTIKRKRTMIAKKKTQGPMQAFSFKFSTVALWWTNSTQKAHKNSPLYTRVNRKWSIDK